MNEEPNVYSNTFSKNLQLAENQDKLPDTNDLLKIKGDNSHKNKEIKIYGMNGNQTGLYVRANIFGQSKILLIDSGADVTILSSKTLKNIDQSLEINPVDMKLISASGDSIPVQGTCQIPIQLGSSLYLHKVLIADIQYDGIIGLDFMTTFSCDIFIKTMSLRIKGEQVPLSRFTQNDLDSICKVVVAKDIILPPNSESVVEGRVIGPVLNCNLVIMEPNMDFVSKYGILVAKALLELDRNYVIPMRVLNPSNDSLTLHENCSIAVLEKITSAPQCIGNNSDQSFVNAVNVDTMLDSNLPNHLKKNI